jgi:hypothetical protein
MGILDPKPPTRAELSATYARFVDQNGNPLTSRHVVIKVDSTTGEIIDIVAEV